MEGRWTISHAPGEWEDEVIGPLAEAMPVVPCDDAAIERAAARSRELSYADDAEIAAALEHGDWNEYVAKEILRAAGETS